jgi:hypothetical protein
MNNSEEFEKVLQLMTKYKVDYYKGEALEVKLNSLAFVSESEFQVPTGKITEDDLYYSANKMRVK